MPRFLRLFLYDDPSRQHYTPLHADIEVDDMPTLSYGQPVQVGDDHADRSIWATHVVAHWLCMPKETDAAGKNKIVYEGFVAKAEEWSRFGWPPEMGREARNLIALIKKRNCCH